MRFSPFILAIACLALPAAAERHWAYEPPAPPAVAGRAHPVDALLAGAWKSAGLRPAALAPPETWVRRAAYTLTGLPPAPEHLRKIRENPDDATWRAVIDELLASPAYGERWARHWMDVARYADTQGYNFDRDNRYPFAYTYRDWLIRAFNDDLPHADFIKLQLAADRLTDRPDAPDLAALGFLTTGPRGGTVETIDDRVDVVTRGFLSSTVACARCHDHKTDPISTEDYYSIYSIFENTEEPGEKPVIGRPADDGDFQRFNQERETLATADRDARQAVVDQLRNPENLAIYLELAWQAEQENWDLAQATGPAFKRGRFRPQAVLRWREFLKTKAEVPEVATWRAAMADPAAGPAACRALAAALPPMAGDPACPLALGTDRIHEIFDTDDGNQAAQRASAVTRLLTEHPGSPPRAMALTDRANWAPAQVYRRGNPADRGDPFEREWLSFLGGGKFPDGKSPRLALAEKIADPANPLTARVWVNRVWGWHFGGFLADPGDFGPQTPAPALRGLLDFLAVRFQQGGGSLKELHRLLLTSRAFRLAAEGPLENAAVDEGNALFWKWNRRRADFEVVRDRVLATAGALDTAAVGGRSFALDDAAADRRRTLYAFVDRYALAGTLVSFDLPHPDHHAPRRVETNVPQQALYFLNSPLVLRQAEKLAVAADFAALADDPARVTWLFRRIYQRDPAPAELAAVVAWVRAADPADYQPRLGGVWQVRHAADGQTGLEEFPLLADGVWKTGPDPATAPIPWLSAGREGGHAGAGRALVLRWVATGPGQVRLTGDIRRSQQGGATLVWRLGGGPDRPLGPDSSANVDGPWRDIAAGEALEFILRAPDGDHCGGVAWDFRVVGRDAPGEPEAVISRWREDFPTTNAAPPAAAAASPWADVVQMLWAANEFNFID